MSHLCRVARGGAGALCIGCHVQVRVRWLHSASLASTAQLVRQCAACTLWHQQSRRPTHSINGDRSTLRRGNDGHARPSIPLPAHLSDPLPHVQAQLLIVGVLPLQQHHQCTHRSIACSLHLHSPLPTSTLNTSNTVCQHLHTVHSLLPLCTRSVRARACADAGGW
jgi:hypothetical protein